MRYLAVALLLAFLLPSVAAAQEDPTTVCTRLAVPEGHVLEDSPALRGEPPDGECDILVYLPMGLADGLMIGTLSQAAREEAERQTEADRWGAMSCPEVADLRNDGGVLGDSAVAEVEYMSRCATCEELDEARVAGDTYAGLMYEVRCLAASPSPS